MHDPFATLSLAQLGLVHDGLTLLLHQQKRAFARALATAPKCTPEEFSIPMIASLLNGIVESTSRDVDAVLVAILK